MKKLLPCLAILASIAGCANDGPHIEAIPNTTQASPAIFLSIRCSAVISSEINPAA